MSEGPRGKLRRQGATKCSRIVIPSPHNQSFLSPIVRLICTAESEPYMVRLRGSLLVVPGRCSGTSQHGRGTKSPHNIASAEATRGGALTPTSGCRINPYEGVCSPGAPMRTNVATDILGCIYTLVSKGGRLPAYGQRSLSAQSDKHVTAAHYILCPEGGADCVPRWGDATSGSRT